MGTPINSGTVEQEQKGVIIPKSAARIFSANALLPNRNARVFSGVKNLLMIPTPKTTWKKTVGQT
jgi:hypothetical protein